MTEDDGWTSSDAGWTTADDEYRARTYRSGDGWAVPEWIPADEELERELDVERERKLSRSWAGEFASVDEVAAESLLGPSSGTILPADGTLLMYGDGGAGKTTLALDLASHLADGRDWLGIETGRPVVCAIVENEGPRAQFRLIVREKLAALGGDSLAAERIAVFDEPWAQLSLADAGVIGELAECILDDAIELLVLGPLATVGMVGGGTPDEVSAFETKLRELRAAVDRPLAIILVHHENKAGDVSGAWERVPDTLLHVQARGNGRTSIVFRKARWSSELHGKTLNLKWTEGRAFEVVDDDAVRDYHAEVLAVFEENDGWRTAKETSDAANVRLAKCREVLSDLAERGDLEFVKGPPGRDPRAHCYRLKTATVLELAPKLPLTPDDDPLDF